MKKYYISIALFLSIFAQINAQGIQFYFTTTAITSTSSVVKIYAQSTSPSNEEMTGCDLQFWYDNTKATLSSPDLSPTAIGLGWGSPQTFTSFIPGTNPNIPIVHNGRFSCSLSDLNAPFNGSNFPGSPGVLLMNLTFTSIVPITEGYLASSTQVEGLAYTNSNFDEYDIVVTGAPAQPLPLELTRLTAQAKSENILVEWATEQEVNFSHFDLERSTDGRSFEKIAKVAGNGALKNNYNYTDKQVEPGIVYYYRLKMNDLDGKFIYSSIVQAVTSGRGLVVLNVSPNPAIGFINIEYDTPEESEMNVSLVDVTGRILQTEHFASAEGANFHKMDISKYPSGTYWLIISDGLHQYNKKVIKAE